jgi:hypothetical protein
MTSGGVHLDVCRIDQTRLPIWTDNQPIRRPPRSLVSVTDEHPLEAEHSCQDFSMQNYIESQNIANFKERLRMETDPGKQKILLRLLADEMAKYAARVVANVQKKS